MAKAFAFAFVSSILILFMENFSHDVLCSPMEKTKQTYVLHLLEKYHSIIASFDLWMSKGAYDVFALIIYFLGFD
jgi:hypothetical protein